MWACRFDVSASFSIREGGMNVSLVLSLWARSLGLSARSLLGKNSRCAHVVSEWTQFWMWARSFGCSGPLRVWACSFQCERSVEDGNAQCECAVWVVSVERAVSHLSVELWNVNAISDVGAVTRASAHYQKCLSFRCGARNCGCERAALDAQY